MNTLLNLGEIAVAALALEGALAIAKRLSLVGERKVAAGDAFIWMLRFGLALAARKAVTEYAGPYLGDWADICAWAAFALVWIAAVRLQRAVASCVGHRNNVEAS